MIGKWGRHTRDHRNPENGKKSRRPYAPCRPAARRLHRRRPRCGAGCQTRIIPLSSLLQTSNNIIQKGLAFVREQSGTVTVPNARAFRDPAPPAAWPRWGCGGGGDEAAPTQWRIPMARLTDTQLVILSSASRRNDRGVDLPAKVTVEALRKA